MRLLSSSASSEIEPLKDLFRVLVIIQVKYPVIACQWQDFLSCIGRSELIPLPFNSVVWVHVKLVRLLEEGLNHFPSGMHLKKASPHLTSCPSVTRREIQIIELMAEGFSTKEVAAHLNISFHTVESHRKNLLSKMKAKNMVHLMAIVIKDFNFN